MIRILLLVFSITLAIGLKAQKIDSIYFHLYTDSLKKGTHNYINVDGKLSDGSWAPLTSREVDLTSSECKFSGNELFVPANFKGEKITVKASLKTNPALYIERTIWIKLKPDGNLPTQEEILRKYKKKKPGKGNRA